MIRAADSPDLPFLLIAEQTAELVGMSRRWLWRAVSAQQFPQPVRVGRATRWRRVDIEAWVDDLAGAAEGDATAETSSGSPRA